MHFQGLLVPWHNNIIERTLEALLTLEARSVNNDVDKLEYRPLVKECLIESVSSSSGKKNLTCVSPTILMIASNRQT